MSVAHLFLQLMFNYDKTATGEYTNNIIPIVHSGRSFAYDVQEQNIRPARRA